MEHQEFTKSVEEATPQQLKEFVKTRQATIDKLEEERDLARQRLSALSPHQEGDKVTIHHHNKDYPPVPAYIKRVLVGLDGELNYKFDRVLTDGKRGKQQLHTTRISHLTPYSDAPNS